MVTSRVSARFKPSAFRRSRAVVECEQQPKAKPDHPANSRCSTNAARAALAECGELDLPRASPALSDGDEESARRGEEKLDARPTSTQDPNSIGNGQRPDRRDENAVVLDALAANNERRCVFASHRLADLRPGGRFAEARR